MTVDPFPPSDPKPGAPVDLVVVGGGVIGLAAAHACAKSGARVTLVEKGEPGTEATWATAGMLSPLAEATGAGPFLEFALRSLDLYPDWVREIERDSGIEVEYRPCGKLVVAPTEKEEAHLVELELLARRHGGVRRLDRPALLALEPGLGPAARVGLLIERDARVDGRRLAGALAEAARRAGVAIVTGAAVRSLLCGARSSRGPSLEGVRLEDGRTLRSKAVLVAAGAWSGGIGALPGPLPVRPVRGQMVAVAGEARVTRSIEGAGVYLTPRDDGRILIGSTMEEVGFRKGNTEEAVDGLLARAATIVPAIARSTVVERWSGLRPGTPDDLPMIGAWPGADGLLVATGHFRNGILLAPATARAVAAIHGGGSDPELPDAFAPDRFVQSSDRFAYGGAKLR